MFTWEDWLRFVVTPLVVAGVTAIVATRNSKKTPHERLKNLVDIHKNMPDHLDSKNVVEGAIARELVDFDRRLAADQRGLWPGIKERIAQLKGPSLVLAIAAVGCVIALVVSLVEADSWHVAVAALVTFFASGTTLFVGRSASKNERESLNRDRAAAEIQAHFARIPMQAVSIDGQLVLSPGDHYFGIAERLVDMGVFKKNPSVRGEDGRPVFSFVLTTFGKEIWDSALAEVERQHTAHWENIAKGHDNEETEGPGRGAPGS